jgi:uncharacterized protein
MKFYNRVSEIKLLREIELKSDTNAQFTVITGRRRIGKTQLILKALEEETILYFFVARKSEILLCKDFQRELYEKLKIPILGEIQYPFDQVHLA